MVIVTRLGLELHQEVVSRKEHPVQKRGGGLFGGRCGNALQGGKQRTTASPQVSFCEERRGGYGRLVA